jgi:hypothetical protein
VSFRRDERAVLLAGPAKLEHLELGRHRSPAGWPRGQESCPLCAPAGTEKVELEGQALGAEESGPVLQTGDSRSAQSPVRKSHLTAVPEAKKDAV